MIKRKSVPHAPEMDAADLQCVLSVQLPNRQTSRWRSGATVAALAMSILVAPFGIQTVSASPFDTARRSAESSFVNRTGSIPDLHLIKQSPGSVTLVFPEPGRIVKWEVDFVFTTQCENDHRIVLKSPAGQEQGLMDRGLGRCSGKAETFTGESNDSTGAFLGSRAKGKWTFSMVDLDNNDFTGSLDEVRLKLTIQSKGIVSEHEVLFSGLPMTIPAAR